MIALLLLFLQGGSDMTRFQHAQELASAGHCSEALADLGALADRHPGVAAIQFALGRCHFDQKDYAAAADALRKCSVLEPGAPEVRYFLGSALALGGQVPEGIEQLQAAVKLAPDFAPAQRVLGMFRIQAGQYVPDVRTALETAIRLDPRDARAEYWLGRFYLDGRDPGPARPHFERALALQPDDAQAHVGLGQTLALLGESDAALAQFDAALRAGPGMPDALIGRASVLFQKQQFDGALASVLEAQKNSRNLVNDRNALWLLCRLYRVLERPTEAQDSEVRLNKIDAEWNQDLDRFRQLQQEASRYRAARDWPMVVKTLEEALRIEERQDSLLVLGDAYMELKRPADAERCFVRALQAGPDNGEIAGRLEVLRKMSSEGGKR